MSDTDTSCYVNTLHRNTPTLSTCIAHTLFFFFPCLFRNGIRRTVKGTDWKNRTAKAAQDFSWTELAQPLTAPECGVTFADRKEKRYTYVNTTKYKDTFFNTQKKSSYPFLTSNLPVFSFPYCFLSFSGSTEPGFLPG
jgi:hypothetical protein